MLRVPQGGDRMRAGFVQTMVNESTVGARMLGFSTLGFGVACFLQRDFTIYWQPVPQGLLFRQALAFVSAALLVASGTGLFFSKTRRSAAIVQVCLFLAYAASWLSLPFVAGSIQPWLGIAEHLAIVVGAATIAARQQSDVVQRWHFSPASARIAYGCCSMVFALAHVVALEGTARLIPAWIPGDPVFWALFTGGCHLAVGLALIFDRLAFLATRLAGLMYLLFAAFAWLPGAVTHPDQWLRWAGAAITLVMLAAVWLVGDYLREPRARGNIASSPTHAASTPAT
jgi:uncharacterized membrane protein